VNRKKKRRKTRFVRENALLKTNFPPKRNRNVSFIFVWKSIAKYQNIRLLWMEASIQNSERGKAPKIIIYRMNE
jgi:hypothetical protein